MNLRILLLSLTLGAGLLSSSASVLADAPAQVALETVPVGSNTVPLLMKAMNAKAVPQFSPSQRMGSDLSKMFKEGAVKLDPPRSLEEEGGAEGEVPVGGRSLSVLAYSYCLTGQTASGRYTAPGIVAVDTRVIPMGSKLYIPGYGWGVAADTGGAIVGNKIDVWFPSLGQCYQWGVRPVTIKVFPKN